MNFEESVNDILYHVKHEQPLYNKHSEFKMKYPRCFAMLCDPDCDMQMLRKILNMHKKIANGKISQQDADMKVGEYAVNKYVKPLVKNT